MSGQGFGQGLILGAYAAAPADLPASVDAERDWYRRLHSSAGVGGLELAFGDSLHPRGMRNLAALLHPDWRSVVTCIPGTGRILGTDPAYGLASDDDAGRRRAVVGLRAVHGEVLELLGIRGRGSVLAVQVPSAPNRTRAGSSAEALTASLAEIGAWDWQGVALMVEHCDAAAVPVAAGVEAAGSDVSTAPPQKGFLTLAEEMLAVAAARRALAAHVQPTVIGHTVNWARSVIETRSVDTVAHQLALLRSAGGPVGLMFSGVSAEPTPFGDAWLDAHLPVALSEPRSLLTTGEIRRAFDAAGPLHYAGVKVGAPQQAPQAQHAEPGADRLAPALMTLEAVRAAAGSQARHLPPPPSAARAVCR